MDTIAPMRLFLDTADTKAIYDRLGTGLISGVTTNPTLMFKSGRHPQQVYRELKNAGIPDISMEITADTPKDFFSRGVGHSKEYGDVTTIKLPCSPDGLWACKKLSDIDIRVNVTLVFSVSQAILAALAGAAYISPFVGRMDDNSLSGLGLVHDIAKVYKEQSVQTKILAASIRDVQSVGKAFELGADICTIPPEVFDKMYKHVLTDKGLKQFNEDANSTTA
tara:strand:- start:380 stop:1045 length:666 start_codon:yes stop_codon:yes gene_type:complete